MKKQNQKGFTLAELLIVVAIIAVLVAIAIPVFTKRLEASRETTDAANLRSAYAAGQVKALAGEFPATGNAYYYFKPDDAEGLLTASGGASGKIAPEGAPAIGKGTTYVGDPKVTDSLPSVCTYSAGTDAQNKYIMVTTSGGNVETIQFVNSGGGLT